MTEKMGKDMETARELGLDVLMTKTLWELLRDIPKRFMALVSKIISYKTVILIGSGYLMTRGHLESWAFLALVVIVLFERAGLKFIKDMKK